jgi:hypothetical protein
MKKMEKNIKINKREFYCWLVEHCILDSSQKLHQL